MPQPRSKNNLFAESERRSQLLRSSTLITRVMSLFGSNDLSVFFCFGLKLSSYEAVFYSPPLSYGSLALRRVPRSHRGGLCFRARRHFRTSPSNHAGRLLLWLCPVENVGRLHQNVRTAQVRLALVGSHLRQAAHDHSHREVRRRAKVAASRPRRTRLEQVVRSPGISLLRCLIASLLRLFPSNAHLHTSRFWFLIPNH
jgi:hypothetical protein